MDLIAEYFFENKTEWYEWLFKNHSSNEAIYLIYYKKNSGITSINYTDAVEVALCFGWIDSKVLSIDDKSYKQYFCKRKKNSLWSLINKQKAEALISEGKMQKAGLEAIEEARKNGRWERAYSSKSTQVLSDDLFKNTLKHNPEAEKNYLKLPPSHQLQYLHWINKSVREDTKLRRIAKAIDMLNNNLKPGNL